MAKIHKTDRSEPKKSYKIIVNTIKQQKNFKKSQEFGVKCY